MLDWLVGYLSDGQPNGLLTCLLIEQSDLWFSGWLASCLAIQMADWMTAYFLAQWQADAFTTRFTGWLARRIAHWFAGCMTGFMADCLDVADWLATMQTCWPDGFLIGWLVDLLVVWLSYWPDVRLTGCLASLLAIQKACLLGDWLRFLFYWLVWC